jgi:hypothetical protein
MKSAQQEYLKKVTGLLTPEQKRQLIEKQKEAMQKAKPAPSVDKKSETQ